LCLLFLAGILAVMFATPDLRLSVYLIPAWLGVLGVGYWLSERRKLAPQR
jgi:aromatic amino acid transport protein AroP